MTVEHPLGVSPDDVCSLLGRMVDVGYADAADTAEDPNLDSEEADTVLRCAIDAFEVVKPIPPASVQRYVLLVSLDELLLGPFSTEEERLEAAKKVWAERGSEPAATALRLNVVYGRPQVFPFTNGELE